MDTAFAQLLLLEQCSECVPQDRIHILDENTFYVIDDTGKKFCFRYDYETCKLNFIQNTEKGERNENI